MEKKIVKCDKAPGAIGPYVQGMVCGDFVFLSGSLGIDPATGELASGVEAQAKQSMENIGALLASEGLSFDNVIKTTIFLADIADFGKVNDIYASFFGSSYPARSAYAVAGLPKGGLVEIEVIAAK